MLSMEYVSIITRINRIFFLYRQAIVLEMGPTMNSNKREPTKGARLWQLTQGMIQLGNLYCVVDREHTWLRRKMWSTGQVVDHVRGYDSKAAGGFSAESEAFTYLWFCIDMFHYMHGKKLSLDKSIYVNNIIQSANIFWRTYTSLSLV